MTLLEAVLIAVALAMDCFTVSISCGILQHRMGFQSLVMALMFGVSQAFMCLIGWATVGSFSKQIHAYDHWVAFILLGALGSKMIWDGMHPKEKPGLNLSKFVVLAMLAVATSIDALAVGCSFVGMGLHNFSFVIGPILIIGVVSFVMTLFGKYVGVKIGHRLNWPAEQMGGLILILIGLKVLMQHLSL